MPAEALLAAVAATEQALTAAAARGFIAGVALTST